MKIQQIISQAQRQGLTQQRMAEITGTSQPTIHRYLSHDQKNDIQAKRIEKSLGRYLEGERLEFAGEVYYLRIPE